MRYLIDSSRDSGWDAVAESGESLAEANALRWKAKVRDYLESLEQIRRADAHVAEQNDPASLALLDSTLDAAKAAYLLIPAEMRIGLKPPPTREDYWHVW